MDDRSDPGGENVFLPQTRLKEPVYTEAGIPDGSFGKMTNKAVCHFQAMKAERRQIMRGIIRLIEGLISGDPETVYILVFAVLGGAVIFLITEIVQRNRKRNQ